MDGNGDVSVFAAAALHAVEETLQLAQAMEAEKEQQLEEERAERGRLAAELTQVTDELHAFPPFEPCLQEED